MPSIHGVQIVALQHKRSLNKCHKGREPFLANQRRIFRLHNKHSKTEDTRCFCRQRCNSENAMRCEFLCYPAESV